MPSDTSSQITLRCGYPQKNNLSTHTTRTVVELPEEHEKGLKTLSSFPNSLDPWRINEIATPAVNPDLNMCLLCMLLHPVALDSIVFKCMRTNWKKLFMTIFYNHITHLTWSLENGIPCGELLYLFFSWKIHMIAHIHSLPTVCGAGNKSSV